MVCPHSGRNVPISTSITMLIRSVPKETAQIIFESIKGYVEENMATITATDEAWLLLCSTSLS